MFIVKLFVTGLFTFGQSLEQPATVPGSGFNFSAGSNSVPANEQKALFTFGASSNSTGQVGNGFGAFRTMPASTFNFTFNAPKPEAAAPTTGGFGQTTPAPMFNAPASNVTALPPAYPGTAAPASPVASAPPRA